MYFDTEVVESSPMIMGKNPGELFVWVFQRTYLNLSGIAINSRAGEIVLRSSAPPWCSLKNSSSSSFLNNMVGFGSHNILLNTEGVKEIGGFPGFE
jgi:hypothetical protein